MRFAVLLASPLTIVLLTRPVLQHLVTDGTTAGDGDQFKQTPQHEHSWKSKCTDSLRDHFDDKRHTGD